MTKIEDILNAIRDLVPEEKGLPDFDDNIGLIFGRETGETDKVLCCLDVTAEVIEEAIESGAKLVVSHHPLIYKPIRRITGGDGLGDKLLRLAENRIAVYTTHTNLDAMPGGINDYVANLLGLRNVAVMQRTVEGRGIGRIGELINPLTVKELACKVSEVLDDKSIRIISYDGDYHIETIAVINGSGGSIGYIDLAREMGADCLVTADVKYHAALYASEQEMVIIEPTHYSMEQIFIKKLAEMLNIMAAKCELKVDFVPSKTEKSPYLSKNQ